MALKARGKGGGKGVEKLGKREEKEPDE